LCPSKGLYPIKAFPAAVGMECAGVIAALPTDETITNSEEYKKRQFQVGSKVAAVRTHYSHLFEAEHLTTT
jgi:NADPH2:quinone reductase